MASGQQLADENVRRFTAWIASKTDDDFKSLALRGVLSRTDIAAECGFAKSALAQNPRIREALSSLETDLRRRGVLPHLATTGDQVTPTPARPRDAARLARDAERLSRLEQENASLKAENAELKRVLGRYTVLQEALAETGRLPR